MVAPAPTAREPLVQASAGDGVLRSFCRSELKIMLAIGWPILVSMFCRFAMFSMDLAFIGHIGGSAGGSLPAGGGPMLAAPLLIEAGIDGRNFAASTGALGAAGSGTKDYLAAASLSDMITNLLVVPLMGMSFGLNPLISQAMGSGNLKMAGTWLQLCVFCTTLATIPLLVCFFFVGDLLRLLGFAPQLCELAGQYAKISSLWVIPNAWYVSWRYYFQAQGQARPAMYFGLIFLVLNGALAWMFVFGGPLRPWCGWSGLGLLGAALSISTSRCMQSFCYWLYMFVVKRAHRATWPGLNWDFLKPELVRSFLSMTIPQVGTLFLQFAINQSTTLLVARLGTLAVAASSAASSAMMPFTLCFLSTLSCVAGIRVGFHLGRGESQLAKYSAWLILASSTAITVIFGAVLLPLRTAVMGVMTSDPQVRDLATELLPAVLLNYLAASVVQCGTGGILASQGRTRLSTALSLGLELPLSLGSVAVLVLWYHVDVRVVYWVQASVSVFEALVVALIVWRSDWARYAEEARQRQLLRQSSEGAPEQLQPPQPSQPSPAAQAVNGTAAEEGLAGRAEKGEASILHLPGIRKAGG